MVYQYELSLELDISELNGAFEYAGIEYSHDYYQSNDELSCFVPLSALRAVLRAVCSDPDRLEAFTNAVRTRMTPHSGWSPFFSTDWKEWGPIANWNAGQVQILLETVVDAERMNESYLEDLSDACREAMRINWEECRAAADRNEAA